MQSGSDYGPYLANEASPLHTTTIVERCTEKLVDDWHRMRANVRLVAHHMLHVLNGQAQTAWRQRRVALCRTRHVLAGICIYVDCKVLARRAHYLATMDTSVLLAYLSMHISEVQLICSHSCLSQVAAGLLICTQQKTTTSLLSFLRRELRNSA